MDVRMSPKLLVVTLTLDSMLDLRHLNGASLASVCDPTNAPLSPLQLTTHKPRFTLPTLPPRPRCAGSTSPPLVNPGRHAACARRTFAPFWPRFWTHIVRFPLLPTLTVMGLLVCSIWRVARFLVPPPPPVHVARLPAVVSLGGGNNPCAALGIRQRNLARTVPTRGLLAAVPTWYSSGSGRFGGCFHTVPHGMVGQLPPRPRTFPNAAFLEPVVYS